MVIKEARRARGAGGSAITAGCRPFHGLETFLLMPDPGACAPGFMLPSAPRTESEFDPALPRSARGPGRQFAVPLALYDSSRADSEAEFFFGVDDDRFGASFINFRYEIAGAAGAVSPLLTIPQRDQRHSHLRPRSARYITSRDCFAARCCNSA